MDENELMRIERVLSQPLRPQENTVTPVEPAPEAPFEAENGFRTGIHTFKNIVRTAALVCKEAASFALGPNGFEFRGIEPSNVFLMDIAIPPTSFTKFASKERRVVALAISELKALIKRSGDMRTVTVSLEEKAVKIVMQGLETKEFKLALQEEPADPEAVAVPHYDSTAKIWMLKEKLKSVIEDTEVLSTSIGFDLTNNDNVGFFGIGDDETESSRVDLPRSDVGFLEVTSTEPAKQSYPIAYLKPILAAIDSEDVVLEFRQGMPLSVKLGIGVRGAVMALALLAPMRLGQKKEEESDEGPAPDEAADVGEEDEPEPEEPEDEPEAPEAPEPAEKPKGKGRKKK